MTKLTGFWIALFMAALSFGLAFVVPRQYVWTLAPLGVPLFGMICLWLGRPIILGVQHLPDSWFKRLLLRPIS